MNWLGLSALLLTLACGDDRYSEERCEGLRDQIMEALVTNVDRQVLVATAIPCGSNGVANDPNSFDSRVPMATVNYLKNEFAQACGEFEDHCGPL